MADLFERVKAALADRYTIELEIGRGGMATVYLSEDVKHRRKVAVKVLRPELAASIGVDRFLREIEIAAHLTHPNILPLFDSGQVDGFLYSVTPFVEGETLRARLDREKHLPIPEAVQIAQEVADALEHAHTRGIIHRDIKPENILLEAGHAVVADFGIAKAVSDAGGEKLTETGIAIGTPAYMSPEQGSAEEVDGRSDIYSLGCVLYEMLGAEPPHTGPSASAIIAKKLAEPVPSVRVVRETVPEALDGLLTKALARVPADRFATANDLLAALRAPDTFADYSPRRIQRRRWVRRAATTVAAVSAIFVVWFVLKPPGLILDSNKIVVFPLEERGLSEAETGAGYDVAIMIGAALEHTAPLKWIDGRRRLPSLAGAGMSLLDPADAREVSLSRRARYYIDGVIRADVDSATVVLRLHDVGGDSIVTQQSATGALSNQNIIRLGLTAVGRLLPALIEPGRAIDMSSLEDRQSSAIALWIQGERKYRSSRFAEALEFYQRALTEDSALVLAAIKGAQAASWGHRKQEAEELVEHALEHDSLLPPRYANFALGLEAYLKGDADSAVAWFQQTIDEDPDWPEGFTALGEVYYHLLPQSAPLDSLAQSFFEATVSLDSGFAPPLYHLAEQAIRSGDSAAARIWYERFSEAGPEQPLVRQLDLMFRCTRNDSGMVWAGPAASDPLVTFRAAKSLSAGAMQYRCSEDAFRALLQSPSATSGMRWGAVLGLQGILVATGRGASALTLLDSVIASGNGLARSLHVLYALAGAPMDEEATALESFAARVFGQRYERLTGPLSLWILGVWHAHNGDAELVDTIAASLDAVAIRTGARRDRMYADAMAAHQALIRQDTADAIDRLRALTSTGRVDSLAWKYGEALPVERLLLARLYSARADFRLAIHTASVFDHPGPVLFLAYLPESLQIRLNAARALRRRGLADEYRERLLSLGRSDLIR